MSENFLFPWFPKMCKNPCNLRMPICIISSYLYRLHINYVLCNRWTKLHKAKQSAVVCKTKTHAILQSHVNLRKRNVMFTCRHWNICYSYIANKMHNAKPFISDEEKDVDFFLTNWILSLGYKYLINI